MGEPSALGKLGRYGTVAAYIGYLPTGTVVKYEKIKESFLLCDKEHPERYNPYDLGRTEPYKILRCKRPNFTTLNVDTH